MPFQPGAAPEQSSASLQAWNLMGGKVDFAALEIVCEILGVRDPEALVSDLVLIRDHMQSKE